MKYRRRCRVSCLMMAVIAVPCNGFIHVRSSLDIFVLFVFCISVPFQSTGSPESVDLCSHSVFARHVVPGPDFTCFMLNIFSLRWSSMFFSHVVLGLPRGLVTFTLYKL